MVPAFADFKDLDDVDPFNASGVDGGKGSKQGKREVDVTAVFTYKTSFVVNVKLETVSHTLGEELECNSIF